MLIIKTYLFLICIGAMHLTAHGQAAGKLDSLVTKAEAIQVDSNRVKAYSDLCFAFRNQSKERAIDFGNKALNLAISIKYPKGEAQAYNDLAIIALDKANYKEALQLLDQALAIRKVLQDLSGMASVYNKYGLIYQRIGKLDLALDANYQYLRLAERQSNKFNEATALNNIASIYGQKHEYVKANKLLKQALDIRVAIKDISGQAACLMNLGNNYQRLKNIKETILYYERAMSLLKPSTTPSNNSTPNQEHYACAINNYGVALTDLAQYPKALTYLNKAYTLRNQQNDKRGAAITLYNIGHLYMLQDSLALADKNLSKAEVILASIGALDPHSVVLEEKALLHKKQGKLMQSISEMEKANKLRDSVLSKETLIQIANAEAKYQTEKKEAQIILLNAQKANQQLQLQTNSLESSRKNLVIILLSLLTALITFAAVLIGQKRTLSQRAAFQKSLRLEQEKKAKAVLEAEEAERTRIARDLHDGIGQTLSAVKLNLSAFSHNVPDMEGKPALVSIIEMLDDSCDQVRTISHTMMPVALEKYGLEQVAADFLLKVNKGNKLVISFDAFGLAKRYPSHIELVLYRILQELVSNALKHSSGTTLLVQISEDGDGLTLFVEDNGKGFNLDQQNHEDGIGLKNIRSRTAYINADLHIDTSLGRGSTFTIIVPPASLKNMV